MLLLSFMKNEDEDMLNENLHSLRSAAKKIDKLIKKHGKIKKKQESNCMSAASADITCGRPSSCPAAEDLRRRQQIRPNNGVGLVLSGRMSVAGVVRELTIVKPILCSRRLPRLIRRRCRP